jgi:transposase
MPDERRTFTHEFKKQAIQMVTDQGYSWAEAARKLGIHVSLLRKWKDKLDDEGQEQPSLVDVELEQLRAENKRLRLERDILKKTVGFFAKESL